jgi:hypothetical protein
MVLRIPLPDLVLVGTQMRRHETDVETAYFERNSNPALIAHLRALHA